MGFQFTSIDFWREYFLNKGFDGPYCKMFHNSIATDSYYAFTYKKFEILLRERNLETGRYPHIVVRMIGLQRTITVDMNLEKWLLLGKVRKASEISKQFFNLIDAIIDPIGSKFLLCVGTDWALPLVEEALKVEEK